MDRRRISTSGTRKARVFPEPVTALTLTSLWLQSKGIVLAWTGVQISKPDRSSAEMISPERQDLRSEKRGGLNASSVFGNKSMTAAADSRRSLPLFALNWPSYKRKQNAADWPIRFGFVVDFADPKLSTLNQFEFTRFWVRFLRKPTNRTIVYRRDISLSRPIYFQLSANVVISYIFLPIFFFFSYSSICSYEKTKKWEQIFQIAVVPLTINIFFFWY